MYNIKKSKDGRTIKVTKSTGLQCIGKLESCSGREKGLSIFVDSSIGCDFGCNYCWLSREPRRKEIHVIENIEIIEKCIDQFEDEHDIYLKFMGQGDAMANKFKTEYIVNHFKRISNLKGVSISTIFPKDEDNTFIPCLTLGAPMKVYISVGSFDPSIRKSILPNALELDKSIQILKNNRLDINLHYTPVFFNSVVEMSAIGNFLMNEKVDFLRIIPYNTPNGPKIKREFLDNIKDLITRYNTKCDILPYIGGDIAASCGMFEL